MHTRTMNENGINVERLDQELIKFVTVPFSTATYNFIVISSSDDMEIRREEAAAKVMALVSALERSYPPQPETDISGIEEIYE